jgi:hypothetical protein
MGSPSLLQSGSSQRARGETARQKRGPTAPAAWSKGLIPTSPQEVELYQTEARELSLRHVHKILRGPTAPAAWSKGLIPTSPQEVELYQTEARELSLRHVHKILPRRIVTITRDSKAERGPTTGCWEQRFDSTARPEGTSPPQEADLYQTVETVRPKKRQFAARDSTARPEGTSPPQEADLYQTVETVRPKKRQFAATRFDQRRGSSLPGGLAEKGPLQLCYCSAFPPCYGSTKEEAVRCQEA